MDEEVLVDEPAEVVLEGIDQQGKIITDNLTSVAREAGSQLQDATSEALGTALEHALGVDLDQPSPPLGEVDVGGASAREVPAARAELHKAAETIGQAVPHPTHVGEVTLRDAYRQARRQMSQLHKKPATSST
jgi:hypothetical protein